MPKTDAPPPRRPHIALVAAVAACVVLVGVAGCSGGTSSDSATSGGKAASQPGQDFSGGGSAGRAGESANQVSSPQSSTHLPVISRALIQTAAVSLHSTDISSVRAKIDQLVAHDGGYIASEDTSTDTDGVEVSSHIELAVPAADFEQALDEVKSFGKAISTKTDTQDVTARVVDVDSRVKSAHDSIAQLRLLFSRATKLGDVIALEDELSQREADLEALQSEQRDLAAQTTMSTIAVDVTSSAKALPTHHNAGGFLAGIRQGWDGMVTFLRGFAHGVGLVLPLGSLVLLAGLATWVAVRRFSPGRRPRPSE